jgi:hypothetical protein
MLTVAFRTSLLLAASGKGHGTGQYQGGRSQKKYLSHDR